MSQYRRTRNSGVLFRLIVLAAAYSLSMHLLPTVTGTAMLDGAIGVLLGLYICSHPAANAIDLIFVERGLLSQISTEWSGVVWLLMNVVVVLVGWLMIVIGVTRLIH
jgi:hypothetical protein